jgi:hypothetical protein
VRPNNQYILERAIPSCFPFVKMSLCQVSLCQGVVRDTCHLLGGVARCLYGPGTRFSSCGKCDMDRLRSVNFYYPVFSQFWIAAR